MGKGSQRKISALICIFVTVGAFFSPMLSLKTEAVEDQFVSMYDSDQRFLEELRSIIPEDDVSSSNDESESKLIIESNYDAKLLQILDELKNETYNLNKDSDYSSSKTIIKTVYDQNRTNRFIVKYKGRDEKQIKKSEDKFTSSILKEFETTHFIEIEKGIEKIVLNKKVNPKEFADFLREKGLSNEIEYIQPDLLMSIASLELNYNKGDEYKEEKSNDSKDEDKKVNNVGQGINIYNNEIREEVIVAIIDTGVDINHQDLVGRIIKPWNIVANNNQIYDEVNPVESDHGTHIAGIIASNSSNNVKIMPIKVFNGREAFTTDIIEAIKYAKNNGAKIVNCSFGGKENNPALKQAIENSGMLFIVAVGNSRSNLEEIPFYPAVFNLDNIISVASLNEDGGFSYFSNYSTEEVDIAALGKRVISSISENRYGFQSGTSVSTAFVSAAAAEIYSLLLTDTSPSTTPSAITSPTAINDSMQDKKDFIQQLRIRLLNGADKLENLLNKVAEGRKLNVINSLEGINGQYLNLNPEDDFDVHTYNPTSEQQYELFNLGGTPIKIEAGHRCALVLLENGTVWEWGRNNLELWQIIGLTNIIDISVGYRYSIALDEYKSLWIWENGSRNAVPIQIMSDTLEAKAGDFHIASIPEFLRNQLSSYIIVFQLGSFYLGPTAEHVNYIDNNRNYVTHGIFSKLSTGSETAILYEQNYGMQKIAIIGAKQALSPIGGDINPTGSAWISILRNQSSIVQIESGQNQIFALKSDGKVICWGRDKYNNGIPLKPIVNSITNVKQISAGGSDLYNVGSFVTFLKNDGTVYEYSNVHNGRVNIDNVKQISSGSECTIALKNDGSIWGWGKGNSILGKENGIVKEPVQISFKRANESASGMIEIESGKQCDIIISAKDADSFENKTFIFTYNSNDLELLDLCVFTKGNQLGTGLLPISGVNVEEVYPGIIRFTVQKQIPQGKRWSGALMSIRFKAKVTGNTKFKILEI